MDTTGNTVEQGQFPRGTEREGTVVRNRGLHWRGFLHDGSHSERERKGGREERLARITAVPSPCAPWPRQETNHINDADSSQVHWPVTAEFSNSIRRWLYGTLKSYSAICQEGYTQKP